MGIMVLFFFNYTASTAIYTYLHTLSLHDALPISGYLFVIERIDEQRFGHLLGGAGEAREDEDAGVFRVLRGDIFLGDQIHAVADRRYQPDQIGRAHV